MNKPLVSIIIPHYQTPELVRLCLHSIRRYTLDVPYEVLVIDNHSRDGRSLEYLRSVEWIRLIERTNDASKGALGHKEAVDIGFAAATAPYVMSFHTDTIPLREDWLSWHVEQLTAEPNIAAVGTYKLELKSPLWRRLRDWSDRLLSWRQAPTKHGDHRPYIRSHCALYRREVLEELGLHYNASLTETAGRDVHFGLEQNGYRANLLSVEETMLRVAHLNHATMVLVSEFGIRGRTARRGRSRIERFFERPDVRAVYDDETLDKLEAQSRAA